SIRAQFPGQTFALYEAEADIQADVDLNSPNDLSKIWSRSFHTNVVEPWKERGDPADISIITMHLSWYVASHFFSPLLSSDSDGIKGFLRDEFRPTNVVCLIDDIYRCQFRMLHHPIRFYFRLGEIIRWRNIEMMLTDMLAEAV